MSTVTGIPRVIHKDTLLTPILHIGTGESKDLDILRDKIPGLAIKEEVVKGTSGMPPTVALTES